MINASDLKKDGFIKFNGHINKALSVMHHAGTGKQGPVTHAKLKDLTTGTVADHRFHPLDKLEDVDLEKKVMEFLYCDDNSCFFMDPVSFEQFSVEKKSIGNSVNFLLPNTRLPIEFYEGNAVNVAMPEYIDLKVTSAPAGIKAQDSTMKEVELENGMKALVPQFITEGEHVRLEIETGKYLERVKEKKQ